MKKRIKTFGVLLAIVFCTLTLEAMGQRTSTPEGTSIAKACSEEEPNPNVGVSIGTVEAYIYDRTEHRLNNFEGVQYYAQTSEGIYLGFTLHATAQTEIHHNSVTYAVLEAINSTEESVTIPDSIKIENDIIPVMMILSDSNLYYGFTENIKNLTIPASIETILYEYGFDQHLDAIYMLGNTPEIDGAQSHDFSQATSIYVCNKEYYNNFLYSEHYKQSSILPYGWDFDWIIVNVENYGEFADTYLTQNDFDWDAAKYLKVVGDINEIDLNAIKNLTSLTVLDLSDVYITDIPERFMYEHSSLVEVRLPSFLERIGDYSFYGCDRLRSVNLSYDLTLIGNEKPDYDINIEDDLYRNYIYEIGNYAFYGCTQLRIIDLSTTIKIGQCAFVNCYSLRSIDLSSAISIGYIEYHGGGGAFTDCTSLRSVIFGDNLQHIEDFSFYHTELETISLPNSLTCISRNTFTYCYNLISVEIPASVTTIGDDAFRDCPRLSNVSLSTGLSTIGDRVFYGCSALEEVTIPNTVNSIGESAFDDTGIKSFKCQAVTPPTASSSFIGYNMDMSHVFLYVPTISKNFYRNTQNWSDFYLVRSLEEPLDYILVDRPLTINLEEEDIAVVANNPTIDLKYDGDNIGQLTATGEGTLSAGQLTISGQLSRRTRNAYQYMPTLINYADKMRADNVTHNLTFKDFSGDVWHFISLPYDIKVSDIIPSENTYWVIRRYDSKLRAAGEMSSTWVNLTNEDTMEAGIGYIVSVYSNYGGNTLSFSSGNSITKTIYSVHQILLYR